MTATLASIPNAATMLDVPPKETIPSRTTGSIAIKIILTSIL